MLTLTAVVTVILLTVTMWPMAVLGLLTAIASPFVPPEPGERVSPLARVCGVVCGSAMAFVGVAVWVTFVFRVIPAAWGGE